MKYCYKTALTLPIVFVLFFSASNSIWPNSNRLSNEDKSSCIQFQLLKGSNRIAEFNKISSIIFLNNNTNCSRRDIDKIFGLPDEVNGNIYTYYLNPSVSNCKVEIAFNEFQKVAGYKPFGI